MAVSGLSVMDDVTLTVKTPNQRVDDIQVSCQIGWTVQKLKEHLSSVYPTKPCKTVQRLIYAGKLLQDHLKLTEVLCKDSDSHTVHIVCSMKDSITELSSSPELNTPVTQAGLGSTPPYNGQPADAPSVRQRSVGAASASPQPANATSPESQPDLNEQWEQYMQSLQQYWNCYYQQQHVMAAAYHHHGMTSSYPGMFASWTPISGFTPGVNPLYPGAGVGQPLAPAAVTTEGTTPPAAAPQLVQQGQRQEQAQPPEPAAAANQNMPRINAGGAMFDDDDEEEGLGRRRDWLDWVYTFLRCGVLLSIMYFYSTVSRLVLVLLLGFIIYLYQNGWFSLPQRQAAAPRQVPENNNNVEDHNGEDNRPVGEQNDNGGEGVPETAEPDERGPGTLSVVWTFVSSFFTSLVPQRPPALHQL